MRQSSTVFGLLLAAMFCATPHANATARDSCSGPTVTCGVNSDPASGDFHGMVAATSAAWVLSTAAGSGTVPGCGDCTWRVALACPTSSPGNSTNCAGSGNPIACATDQLLYRLYLSDGDVTDEVVGELCLGGTGKIVAIGDQATADVARYLQDVTPPRLTVQVRPRPLTLTDLPTRVSLSAPPAAAADFGGPEVTESITLQLAATRCRWGDHSGTGWITDDHRLTHRYLRPGSATIRIAARWGATYTVHYAGRTFGPYDATGQVTGRQSRAEQVATSAPVLVSG